MHPARWLVLGFVAGLALAGGIVLYFRDVTQPGEVGDLKAQVTRLEDAVARLSDLVKRNSPAPAPATAYRGDVPPATPAAPPAPTPAQRQAIADAEALVEQGLQSGHWSMQQAEELNVAVSGLDPSEQGRILARVSKAINDGQMRFDAAR